MLVSTYAPVLQECFKGLMILSLHELSMRFIHCQPSIFILIVCVVYADACSTRTSKFAVACGHLSCVAIMLWQQCMAIQPEPSCLGVSVIVFWLVDLCWTLASSLYCTFIVFDYIKHVPEMRMAFTVSIIFAIHTWTSCPTYNIADLMVRFILYCIVCALLMFGGQVVLSTNDKYAQIRNVKWTACFVLFTAWAVLVPGLLVIISVYIHAFYRKKQTKHQHEIEDSYTSASRSNITLTPLSTSAAHSAQSALLSNTSTNGCTQTTHTMHSSLSASTLTTASNKGFGFVNHTNKTSQMTCDSDTRMLMRQLAEAKAAAEGRTE